MTAQAFALPWPPTAKGRPRFVRATGRTYTPAETRSAEAALRHLLIAQGAAAYPAGCPLVVVLTFRVRRPKSAPRRIVHPATRPDLDQYVKLVLDAGNGIIWPDDAQIVSLRAGKMFARDGDGGPSISLEVAEA